MFFSFNKSKSLLFSGVFLFFVFLLFFSLVPQSQAAIASCSGAECGLNDITQTAINISRWILGITGSLALLMFIYGGVVLLTSGGNQDRVAQGKQILTNALIGIVAVFAAYLIISFVLSLLGIESQGWATGGLLNN